jgi:UDP-N-acetylmuramoyl-L-alanyl-D-glutamate--2,6-diaminopimelate ligase
MTQFSSSTGVLLADLLPQVKPPLSAVRISSVAVDSRLLEPGGLFIACPGLQVDGRDYMDQAVAAGAAAIVAEAKGCTFSDIDSVAVILMDDLSQQVSAIASRFYGHPSAAMKVTGFTGTNGKTTCSQLLAELYQLLGETCGVIGTLGYGVFGQPMVTTGMTTPNAVQTQEILAQLREAGARTIAMEVSSHSLDQNRVADVHFTTAVFTNLSRDHLDYHGTFERYSSAKAALFASEHLKLAIVNGDDPAAKQMLAQVLPTVTCYQFSFTDRDADIYAEQVVLSDKGISARITTPWGDANLQSMLLGRFNLSNLLAVIAVACGQGFALTAVMDAVSKLTPVDGRMEVVTTGDVSNEVNPSVVVDFAHTPDALEKALAAMSDLTRGKLWCVFGCGGDRDRGKRAEMAAVACKFADHVIVTSDNPRRENPEKIIADILQGVNAKIDVQTLVDRQQAIECAIANAGAKDCVLIAGKGHEQYQDVNGTKLPFCDLREAHLALRQRADQRNQGGQQ